MKHVKTIALCAVVALGVGATSATAGTLITGAKIKNGTVAMRDLTPGVQAMIKKRPINGLNGATGEKGAYGMKGADGTNGLNGKDGLNGTNGTSGTNGADGKDGKDYDRIVGQCPGTDLDGEVSIADGMARLGVPSQNSWAQIRSYPKNLKVSDIDTLSFIANATDVGQTYMKVRTTGHNTITFSPNTQADGERIGEPVTYDVLNGTSRWNDDAGIDPDFVWEQILEKGGNEHVKSVSVVAGCAGGDGGVTLVDDITVNNEVIDFN